MKSTVTVGWGTGLTIEGFQQLLRPPFEFSLFQNNGYDRAMAQAEAYNSVFSQTNWKNAKTTLKKKPTKKQRNRLTFCQITTIEWSTVWECWLMIWAMAYGREGAAWREQRAGNVAMAVFNTKGIDSPAERALRALCHSWKVKST